MASTRRRIRASTANTSIYSKAGWIEASLELLAPFGLNAADPAFWSKGLKVIEGMIDELEAMERHGYEPTCSGECVRRRTRVA